MRRMIVIAFFQQLAVSSSALMQLHGLLFLFLLYRKRNIDLLATHFARKRNLFVKVQGIEITRCTLAGLMCRADPASRQTRLHGKFSARLAGIPAPRYWDLG